MASLPSTLPDRLRVLFRTNPQLSANAKLLFAVLLSRMKYNSCYPGEVTLLRDCSFGRKNFRRLRAAIEELEAGGLIHVTRTTGRANVYRIVRMRPEDGDGVGAGPEPSAGDGPTSLRAALELGAGDKRSAAERAAILRLPTDGAPADQELELPEGPGPDSTPGEAATPGEVSTPGEESTPSDIPASDPVDSGPGDDTPTNPGRDDTPKDTKKTAGAIPADVYEAGDDLEPFDDEDFSTPIGSGRP
jgi:hypothetical protein